MNQESEMESLKKSLSLAKDVLREARSSMVGKVHPRNEVWQKIEFVLWEKPSGPVRADLDDRPKWPGRMNA